LFKSGDVWREQLDFPSSGVAGDPIQIGSYGSGTAPIISGADLVPSNLWKQCTGCSATIWEASVKTQPHVVLFNGAKGKKQSSISQLSSAMEWFWSGGLLYVWASGNPGLMYFSPGVEAGARQLGIGFFGISYVTVQNLQFVGVNGLPTNGAIYAQALQATGQSSHDLDFNRVTVRNSAADGIHFEDCNNCIVENSTVSGMDRAGIMLVNNHPQFPVTCGATLANTVSYNHFDGISTYGCAIGGQCEGTILPQGLFLSGLIISHNSVYENGAGIYIRWTNYSSVTANSSYKNADTTLRGEGYGIGAEASSHNTFQKNLLYSNRTRGIELSSDSGAGTTLTGSSYNTIQYNAIHDDGDHGAFTNGAPTQANHFLYNLVWNHPNGECFIANGTGHVVYGNTCWNSSTGVDLYTSGSSPTTANIAIKNNIFAKNLNRAVHIEGGVTLSSLTFDYNDYEEATSTPFLLLSQAEDLKTWQSKGFDVHSLMDNPLFVNSIPSAPSDFALQSASPLAARGTNLGARFAKGLDALSSWPGGVRTGGQGTAWSMGAFTQKP